MKKKPAIIIDLDGTLVSNEWRCRRYAAMTQAARDALDWEKEIADTVTDLAAEWCLDIVHGMALAGYTILFVTGRTDAAMAKIATENWLLYNLRPGTDYELIMRKHLDLRPDFIVKKELYFTHIEPIYDVKFAIDDKKDNIDMWNSIGIKGLHCADY